MTQITPSQRAGNYQLASEELKRWANSFKLEVDAMVEDITRIASDDYELPDGCPSKFSAANLCFQQIEQKKRELDCAVIDFEKAYANETSV